jgi:hypothetical protein
MKKEPLLIRLVSPFRGLLERYGIDYPIMLQILRLKLTLDDRRGPTIPTQKRKKTSSARVNLFTQAFMGVFIGMMMFLPLDLFYKAAVVAAMDLFFMSLYMISDYSGVLLDVRDREVILTRPVDSRTLNAAKMIHVTYYMLSMFFALNGIAIITGVVTYGPMMILPFLIMTVLLSLFVIFLTTIIYSILLERFDGERLRDIINVFQIAMSVVTVVAYQLMARVFEFVDLQLTITIRWWTYLLPPAWYAGLFEVIINHRFTPTYLVLTALAVFVPIVLGIWLIRNILPKFESYLVKLQNDSGMIQRRQRPIKEKIMSWMSKDHTELAFMQFADANLSRDRRLKLSIYPNQALAVIMPLIMLFSMLRTEGGLSEALISLKGSMYYLTLYLTASLIVTNFEFIQYSEKPEAAFIYDSFPIENKNMILSAAEKAFYLKYGLPTMVVLGAIFLYLTGWTALPGILLITVTVSTLLKLKLLFGRMFMPFSVAFASHSNRNVAMVFGFMAISGAFAAVHAFLLGNHMGLTLVAVAALIVVNRVLGDAALKKHA